jgi:hypothetical protein
MRIATLLHLLTISAWVCPVIVSTLHFKENKNSYKNLKGKNDKKLKLLGACGKLNVLGYGIPPGGNVA